MKYTLGEVDSAVRRALRLLDTNTTDIALMQKRIDIAHRDLCAMAPWPALRAEWTGTPATGGAVSPVTGGDFAGVEYVECDGRPAWYVAPGDQYSGDLRGRVVWTRAGTGSIKIYEVSEAGEVAPYGDPATIGYWAIPGALSTDSATVSLPSIRALTARAVLDCIGLMDRKEPDANPWRNEFQQGMQELAALAPQAMLPQFRLASGRVLQRAPIYPILVLAARAQQPAPQQQ